MKRLLMLLPAAALFFAVGCDSNDGPMEELGEEVDEAAEDIEDSVD
ncbi:hypothetical protein [Maricaulis sp.]|tara:strand:+ start:11144 stop:11281 length:138 start_codon:yes stop_codon:yes gene_type:complete